MTTDVVGLFDTPEAARAAVWALEQAGFAPDDIRVEAFEPPDPTAAPADPRPESGWDRLLEKLHLIAPRHGAEAHGPTLVHVAAADRVAQAAAALGRAGARHLDEYTASVADIGAAAPPRIPGSPTDTQVMDAATLARLAGADAPSEEVRAPAVVPQAVIPIVEEELSVGTETVPQGAVRVQRLVTERPVEEEVTLREQHVTVDRRPADRPATAADYAFQAGVIELAETEERAVVAKSARVVEEVVVRKVETRHTETVRETVRRTEVNVAEDTAGGV